MPVCSGSSARLSPRAACSRPVALTATWPGAHLHVPLIKARRRRCLQQLLRQLARLAAASPSDAGSAHAPLTPPGDDAPLPPSKPDGGQAAAPATSASAASAASAAAAADKAASAAAAAAVEKAGIAEQMDKASKLIDEILEEIMRELFAEQVRAGLVECAGSLGGDHAICMH